jgi:type II secretory pathway pseudopilin PulG
VRHGASHRRSSRRPTARGGFTLVELVTAASLMTVLMVGVIQIFATVTQTASQAEGLVFAQQQARAVFDRLHNELRTMTREGYLKIIHSSIQVNTSSAQPTIATPGKTGDQASGWYNADTLAFVAIGPYNATFPKTNQAPTNAITPVAEVQYTSNVKTPTKVQVLQATGIPDTSVDARRGLLTRGQWLFKGSSTGFAADNSDLGRCNYLFQMFSAQPPALPKDRISAAPINYQMSIDPWITQTGKAKVPDALRQVLASCVSEFCIEVYDPGGDNGIGYGNSINAFTVPTAALSYYGSMSAFPSSGIANSNIKTWPRAIRVTIAIHDPGDSKTVAAGTRFEGFTFQEIFWLTDP